MFKRAPAEMVSAGAGSFVQVATNVIGILIILLMVVGQRARRAPLPSMPAKADLAVVQQTAAALERDVHRVAAETESVQQEITARHRERAALAALVEAASGELARWRATLDAESRGRYDLARELAVGRAKLKQIEDERNAISEEQPPALKIESYPTPISKTVDGKEVHFLLKAGRIAWIPVDQLLDKFKSVARSKAADMKDEGELTETIAPVDGFRLRYTLERIDIPFEVAGGAARGGGSVVQLSKWEVIPVAGQAGETLDTALSRQSLFRARLDSINPRDWTITVWTYPDSFDEFRRLRKELYELGYATAGRPLPEGINVGGSPRGSKSAAE